MEETVGLWQDCLCNSTNIQYFSHLPPPQSPQLTLPLLFLSPFLCASLSFSAFSMDHSLFLLVSAAGWASPSVKDHSVWCLAALLCLCITSLHHVNLLLTLRRGLFTTHVCLHATTLWIEEITLTLDCGLRHWLAGWLAGFQRSSNTASFLSHSYSIQKCFVSKSAYCRWEADKC